MQRLRTLLVDDVALARQRMRRLLGAFADVDVVGEAADVDGARRLIGIERPDLLFLDIEMPEQDGFDLVAALPRAQRPFTVFVTAYEHYAVRAFDADAADYLLKPVEPARLALTLERVRAARALRVAAPGEAAGGAHASRLTIPGRDGTAVVDTAAIDWIEAAGNYLCIRAGAQTHILRETLGQMQARLDPARFARVHRSRIVNIGRIARLVPLSNGDHTLVLDDGTTLGLSRTYRDALFRALGRPA